MQIIDEIVPFLEEVTMNLFQMVILTGVLVTL